MEFAKTIYKKTSYWPLEWCKALGITANQVTIFNHIITLTFGVFFMSRGNYISWLMGLGILLFNGWLDFFDGDLARYDKNNNSELGNWLDCSFDVIIQNAVLGAIGIGCYKMGLPLIWIVLFFVGNIGSNFVSFNYNNKFGFDSYRGNDLFRNLMDKKSNPVNIFFKNLIDPTSNHLALIIFTYRYFIMIGCIFNIMPYVFTVFTIITNFKWFIMFILYAYYLKGDKNLHVLKALSILDEERDEFFALRYSKRV